MDTSQTPTHYGWVKYKKRYYPITERPSPSSGVSPTMRKHVKELRAQIAEMNLSRPQHQKINRKHKTLRRKIGQAAMKQLTP